MKIEFTKRTKYILSIMLILVGIILLGNTNNNPTSFIERILKPINIGSATLYYSSIIPMIFIYYGFKGMNNFGNHRWFQTRSKRIIAVFVILTLMNGMNAFVVKKVKSLYKDLNAIYYERKNSNNDSENYIEYRPYNNKQEIFNCKIILENCSKDTQEFFIKVQVPEFIEDSIVQNELTAKSEDLKANKKFVLYGKQRKIIQAVFLGDLTEEGHNHSGSSRDFKIVLVNHKDEVKFTKKYSE